MFNFTVKPYQKKDGSMAKVILVTGDNGDDTYQFRDEMKKQFGAQWISSAHAWGWYASNSQEGLNRQIETMVKPAIQFLLSKEQGGDGSVQDDEAQGDGQKRNVEQVLDQLLKILGQSEDVAPEEAVNAAYMSKREIMDKVMSFKEKVVGIVTSRDFLTLMEPVFKMKKAMGYQFSFANCILIWVQNPKATNVRSRNNWTKANRKVKEDAQAIGLYVPFGGKSAYKTKEERERAKQQWLAAHNYTDEKELTVGDRDKLDHYLKRRVGEQVFKFSFNFYDVADTEQIEGTEDVVGHDADVAWADTSTATSDSIKEKVECLIEVIKDSGVQLRNVNDLGGALGVSKGGTIEFVDDGNVTMQTFLTLAHEFGHELLHHKYLKDRGTEFSDYYIGRPEGRKLVEQQAGLIEFMVENFYFNVNKDNTHNEAVNYTALWGATDAKLMVKAFDSVVNVANFMIDKINQKIRERRGEEQENNMEGDKEPMNESIIKEGAFTGMDLANMLGLGEKYQRGKEELNMERQKLINEFTQNFHTMNERISKADDIHRLKTAEE